MKARNKVDEKVLEDTEIKPSRIAPDDRIKQADAAKILDCTRQRIAERIKKGSLKFVEVEDVLGNVTKFVSLKQVQALKGKLE